jgi:hypothetical protein
VLHATAPVLSFWAFDAQNPVVFLGMMYFLILQNVLRRFLCTVHAIEESIQRVAVKSVVRSVVFSAVVVQREPVASKS